MLNKLKIFTLLKLKFKIILISNIFIFLFSILIFVAIFISDEDSNKYRYEIENNLLSQETLKYKELVEKYANEYDISEYINILLAIIQVESEGTLPDIMQSSESAGLPPNTIDNPEDSIKQGCKYFSTLIQSAKDKQVDEDTIIQAYNYGIGFIDYISKRGKKYTFELAQSFAKQQSNGQKVIYKNHISQKINGGWRYKYGNMFYVMLIRQYIPNEKFDDETVQILMNEALKYYGYKYVFGGDNPETSFDCSGLTRWCYQKIGINLPRTAQEQYNISNHIPINQAKAGDLVFFHSTYKTSDYVTHLGIYLGNMKMYHAGDPIGYADISTPYWQERLICAGRVIN